MLPAPGRPVPDGGQLTSPLGATPRLRARWHPVSAAAVAVPWAMQLTGLALWLAALPAMDVAALTDLGLPSVMPPLAFAALALVAAAFALGVTGRGRPWPLLATNLGIMLVMLYGVTPLIQDAPRFAITYVHVGFAEAIGRTGELFPNLDARFEWPVFFILVAFASEVVALDPLVVANWVPLLTNLLYLGPLWVLVRSATADRRLAWLTLWVFLATNWVGQDYLSPQGFNILLYLAVLAVLVTWFRAAAHARGWLEWAWRWIARVPGVGRLTGVAGSGSGAMGPRTASAIDAPVGVAAGVRGRNMGGLVLLVVLLFAVSAASHQLTPIVLVAGVAALVLFQRMTLTTLPVAMGALVATWMTYMAVTYLDGHLTSILREVGQADVVAGSAVGARLGGSPDHVAIVYLRLAATLGAWLVAGIGVLRRLRSGTWDLTFVLLAAVPFGAVGLQSYGGEILLRVYLFALPFVAFFIAAAFLPRPARPSRAIRLALVLAAVGMVWLLPFTRYGNERADWMSADEYAAAARVYAEAPPGSLLVTANYNAPIRYRDVERYRYRTIGTEVVTSDVDRIVEALVATDAPASYLFLTRSHQATAEMFSGLPPGAWERLLVALRSREELVTVFRTEDTQLWRLVAPVESGR